MAGIRKATLVHRSTGADDLAGTTFLNLQRAGDWTMAQAFDAVCRERIRSKSHMNKFLHAMGHWRRLTADPPLREITSEVAQRFVDAMLAENYSSVTVQSIWYTLSSLVGMFYSKNNANRKRLGVLSGAAPRATIPETKPIDPATRLNFDPLSLNVYDAWWRYVFPDVTNRATLGEYEGTLRVWEELTGNPPLREITNQTLDRFKNALLDQELAPATVNKRLRTLRVIFRRLGPQETRNPAGLGILYRIPYTRPAREMAKLPRTLTMNQLARIYAACSVATWPQPERSGITPRLFWQSAIVLGYNLGLSREELFGLKHEAINLDEGLVTLIRGKTQRALRLPINEAVRAVIEQLWRPDQGEYLLYATASNRQLYEQWHAIQRAAGVSEPYFGFHDLRRTCATELERLSPGAGTFMLGHSTPAVTWKHYRNPSMATREAASQLAQPMAIEGPAP